MRFWRNLLFKTLKHFVVFCVMHGHLLQVCLCESWVGNKNKSLECVDQKEKTFKHGKTMFTFSVYPLPMWNPYPLPRIKYCLKQQDIKALPSANDGQSEGSSASVSFSSFSSSSFPSSSGSVMSSDSGKRKRGPLAVDASVQKDNHKRETCCFLVSAAGVKM